MTSKKHRNRSRRRAEKLMVEAYAALEAGEVRLADKLSQRAVDCGHVNPRLWNDRGRIATECGLPDDAEAAFRQAIALAPTFVDAFARLAALLAGRGKLVQAERLQGRAVELAPHDYALRAQHALYAAELPRTADAGPAAAPSPPLAPAASPPADASERTEPYDWDLVADQLKARGCARIAALLAPAEQRQLAALWDDPERVEHAIVIDAMDGASATFRWFQPPLPEPVGTLRTELYARAAGLADRVCERLGRPQRYPPSLRDWLDRHGESYGRPGVRLVRLDAGGTSPPEREGERRAFPLRVIAALGPAETARVDLVELRPGKGRHGSSVSFRVGDAVVFAARERLVQVGGAWGLQPVEYSVRTDAPASFLEITFDDV